MRTLALIVFCSCIYAIHHNPAYFPSPGSFLPERWIPGQMLSPEQAALANRAFNPFLLGQRNCSGQNMAIWQIYVTIARVIYSLDFRRQGSEPSPGDAVGGDALRLGNDGRVGRDSAEVKLACCFTSIVNGPTLEFSRR